MIGTRIRGLHHLNTIMDGAAPSPILITNGRNFHVGVVYNPTTKFGNKALLFFQNVINNSIDYSDYDTSVVKVMQTIQQTYRHVCCIRDKRFLSQFGSEVILLPSTFTDDYNKFCEQNKKIVNSYFGRVCTKEDAVPMYMYALCGDKPNLWNWAMTTFYKRNATLFQIQHIVNWQDNYPQLVGKLSKGTPTAYNSQSKVLDLMDEIVSLRQAKRANDAINTFNTAQKKVLKSMELSVPQMRMLSRFRTLSGVKQSNFVRKMSTIDCGDEILRQLAHLTHAQFEWNKDSVLDFIQNGESIKAEIIMNDNNILLVTVSDYDTIKYLAKTTNWCISKNKSYWNNYIEHRHDATQYILFNFNRKEDDEYSIVGFTTDRNGCITHAHSFTNQNMMDSGTNTRFKQLKSFNIDISSIFTMLKEVGIPMSMLAKTKQLRYDWDRRSFLGFIASIIDEDNYTILSDEDNKLAIITRDPMIRFALPEEMYDRFSHNSTSNLFLFLDFNEDSISQDRLYVGEVDYIYDAHEERCVTLLDAYNNNASKDFDMLLDEFNLPYDIISRVPSKLGKFVSDFTNYRLPQVKLWLDVPSNLKLLKNLDGQVAHKIISAIRISLRDGHSLDYFKLIQDYGIELSTLSKQQGGFDDFVQSLVWDTENAFAEASIDIPESVSIESLYDTNIPFLIRRAHAYLLALEMLMGVETNYTLYTSIIHNLDDMRYKPFILYLTDKLLEMTNGQVTLELPTLIHVICKFDANALLEKLLTKQLTQEFVECVMSFLPSSHSLFNAFKTKREKIITSRAMAIHSA